MYQRSRSLSAKTVAKFIECEMFVEDDETDHQRGKVGGEIHDDSDWALSIEHIF